ncbi:MULTISPECIES: hypothetical protein [Sorangium]|uniref:hypothetical protein n=1 Tax=Sorangium TaxID=39643 RepID=UPI0002EA3816|nr:hypothetical protein [Sorangium cellulosum]
MGDAPKRRLPVIGSGAAGAAPPRGGVAAPEKRKLPVLQSGGDDEGEDRPPWHWIALGTVAIFIAWLPLAGLVNTLLRRMIERAGDAGAQGSVRLAMVGLNVIAFALAGVAGGYLVGRFGGRAGRREAAASGAVVAALAWALALAEGAPAGALGWALLLVVVVTIGSAASYAGGSAGLRSRAASGPPRSR